MRPAVPESTGGFNQLLSSMMLGLNQSGNKITGNNIEHVVDKKLKEMEERMMSRIDERISRLEDKLENHLRLMTLLSDQKDNK